MFRKGDESELDNDQDVDITEDDGSCDFAAPSANFSDTTKNASLRERYTSSCEYTKNERSVRCDCSDCYPVSIETILMVSCLNQYTCTTSPLVDQKLVTLSSYLSLFPPACISQLSIPNFLFDSWNFYRLEPRLSQRCGSLIWWRPYCPEMFGLTFRLEILSSHNHHLFYQLVWSFYSRNPEPIPALSETSLPALVLNPSPILVCEASSSVLLVVLTSHFRNPLLSTSKILNPSHPPTPP